VRSDARANRDAVVAAARTLVSAVGADVPLSTVAEEAGVGIATLYRHFPTRDDLLAAVALDARDRVLAVVDEHLPRVSADPAAGWPNFVRALAELRLATLLPELAGFLDAGTRPAEVAEVRRATLGAVGSVLDVVRRAGVVRDDATAVRFTLGLGVVSRPLPDGVPVDPADQQAWMTEVYLRGLRP
jgi:AcrR family transcriptional regulator